MNHTDRVVLFGAWDEYRQGNVQVILKEDWVTRHETGRRNPGYPEAVEYARLVLEAGYTLKTFAMTMANKDEHFQGLECAKIGDIDQNLTIRSLRKEGDTWLAFPP